jgi:hypothetical protein
MEFAIWIVYIIIVYVMQTLTAVIPVSDPMWRVGLGRYGWIGASILCIYTTLQVFNKKCHMKHFGV